MKVVLVANTQQPEMTCALAAKLCHEPDERGLYHMIEYLTEHPEHIQRVIRHVIKMGHTSVIEHASFTFYVEGVSRALTHQLVRHRIASYSQQSQRHVDMSAFDYVVPPDVGDKEFLRTDFRSAIDVLRSTYDTLVKSGIKKEDARFLLPNACTTKIIITMNARALHNFFKERLSKYAQWEIREMAKLMLKEVKTIAPTLFEMFDENGPIAEVEKSDTNAPK